MPPTAAEVADLLRRHRSNTRLEVRLQDAMAKLLTAEGIVFEREHSLGKRDRIDFYLPSVSAGIEVKVDGATSAVTRQLHRYLRHPSLDALILCTTLVRHTMLPPKLAGKPLHIACLASL